MNRRQLVITIATACVASPAMAETKLVPSVEFEADDFAAVRYRGGSNEDDMIRSVYARVSVWADENAAEEHRQFMIANAGSNLPDGEFYQSTPIEYQLPLDLVIYPVTAMGWNTTVGVAAYRTEWILLSVRRSSVVWDLKIAGAETQPVLDLAGTMAASLTRRELSAEGRDLFRLLPREADVPDGLTLEYRMSPVGTIDANGTPIPEPTPA